MTADIRKNNDWDGDLATLGLSKLLDGDLSDTELNGTWGKLDGVILLFVGNDAF